MSGFCKVLWPIVVPAGDWDFGFNDGGAKVATVAAGTYTSILSLVSELATQMNAASAVNFTGTVSSVGIVAITGDAAWNTAWGTTDNAFSTMLGYAETEATASNILTATTQHHAGYYPGVLSYGYNAGRGAGLTEPLVWRPTWPMVRSVAGSGAARIVGPVTPSEDLVFACSIIKWTEFADEDCGVRAWLDECIASPFRLYPDRYTGTVAVPGTLGTTYYSCTFANDLKARNGPHPDFCSYAVELHRESKP
jgi:hypothetical protein